MQIPAKVTTLPRLPTEAEFQSWNSEFGTDVLRFFCEKKVEFIKNSWAAGGFSAADAVVMGLKQAEMLGALRAYAEIAGLDFATLISELGEAENDTIAGPEAGPGTDFADRSERGQ